ncbi:MAG: heavy metal translocating P-type ATPase [Candidatus Micrarchaeota archaeon]|nr:heavy metal translocating P-type ATPase [Candidatus Micrarchaeota archaeon]
MTKTIELKIQGMHCVSCASLIKKKLTKLHGIKKAEISYSIEKGLIEYDENQIREDSIIKSINELGYLAIALNKDKKLSNEHIEISNDTQLRDFKNMFLISAILSTPVITMSMLDIKIENREILLFILTSIVQFYCGKNLYKNAVAALKNMGTNMDVLIVLGTSAAYIYSLLAILGFFEHHYFEIPAAIITIVLFGRYLEEKYKRKMNTAIKRLIELQPQKARLLTKNNEIVEVPVENVNQNDIVIVKAGERIPIDGIIVEGTTHIDESMLTGEPLPVKKSINSNVFSGTVNKEGVIKVKATKSVNNTMLARIIKAVEQVQASKPKIQRFADYVSSIFIPIIIAIASLTFISWFFLLNKDLSFALMLSIAVLVISCPCALGIATPSAIIVATGIAAEKGILIKNAEVLEQLEKVNTIVFDKTGTLTLGKPTVTDFIVRDETIKKTLLDIAYTLESYSSHPLANAIINYAKENNAKKLKSVSNVKEIEGHGITGYIKSKKRKLQVEIAKIYDDLLTKNKEDKQFISEIENLRNEGKTLSAIYINKKIMAVFAISDTIRDNSKEVIKKLKDMNISVYLLTGDNRKSAMMIGKKLGIDSDKVIYEVLPTQKAEKIKELQKNKNFVAMVGDGINDSVALAQANVSIAFGSGSDIAIENSAITIINNDPNSVFKAIRIGKLAMDKIRQNFFWAFIYNIVCIPVAAGILYASHNILLSPMIAAFAMALSSFSVVINTLHMRLINID